MRPSNPSKGAGMTDREAMKLACKALRDCHYYMINAGLPNQSLLNEAFTAYMELEAALAKQPAQQEPVAWQYRDANDDGTWSAWLGCDKRLVEDEYRQVRALFTSPQPAPVQQEPVAVVSGYYGGKCVILPIDPARIFNSNTALYTTPPAAPVQEPVIDHSCKDTYELIMKWADIYAAQTGELYSQAAQDPSKAARMADERTMLACVVAQAFPSPAAPVQDDMPKIGCVNHDCDKCKAAAPVQELEKAAAMALDAIAASGDFLFNWHDCEPNNEREMDGYSDVLALNEKAFNALRKCLLTPASQRQWVGLTDEEKSDLWCESTGRDCVNEDTHVFADAIEAKLKGKNT
jgi:hypothetical protein